MNPVKFTGLVDGFKHITCVMVFFANDDLRVIFPAADFEVLVLFHVGKDEIPRHGSHNDPIAGDAKKKVTFASFFSSGS